MAESKVSARSYLLFADAANTGTYTVVACLTSNAITSSNNIIDASSKCGDDYEPGPNFKQQIKADGFAIDQTGTPSKDSYDLLYSLHVAKTKFAIKMGPSSPASGNVVYGGQPTDLVFISNWDLNAPDKEDVKFSATFEVVNPPLTQTKTA
jgi:hypothetical protein